MTMTDVSAGFAGRGFSPRGTLGAVTARYGIPDPNVLCQVDLDDARKDAETPEARISQRERNGGLDAIPWAVMDLMVVRGMPQGHEGRGIVAWTKSLHSFILTGRQAAYYSLEAD